MLVMMVILIAFRWIHLLTLLIRLFLLVLIFLFSSRRRHTRFTCDWSSDVCSSDLSRSSRRLTGSTAVTKRRYAGRGVTKKKAEGRSEERREGKSVDLGGRRIIK